MFWKITAISLGIACLILAYRNRRLLRFNRVLMRGLRRKDATERAAAFISEDN